MQNKQFPASDAGYTHQTDQNLISLGPQIHETPQKQANEHESAQNYVQLSIHSPHHQNQEQDNEDSESSEGEEADLLEEHKQLLERILRNHQFWVRLQRASIKHNQSAIQDQNCIFKQITLDHYLFIFFRKLREAKPKLVSSFLNHIHGQKSFYRFLQHLYYSYPNIVINRVFRYLFYTWEFYNPCARLQYPLDQSILISKRIADRIYKCEAAVLVEMERELQELRQLIDALTLTVVLVLAKIAVNPMLSRINNKRKQSQEYTNQISYEEEIHKIVKRDSLTSQQ